MFLLKFILSIVSHSHALQADALQSLSCSVIALSVLISIKIAQRPASKNYPYGYGKIEFLTSCLVNSFLLVFAVIFLVISLKQLIAGGTESPPDMIALIGALVSIVANEGLFRYGLCAAQHLNSPALTANAWKDRADAMTSVAVALAIIGANIGLGFLDQLVAVVIILIVIRIALPGIAKAIKGLMDYSPKIISEKIKNLTCVIKDVVQVKNIKTRLLGSKIWVDMEVVIPKNYLLAEGLNIAQRIKQTLMQNMNTIADVTVRLSTSVLK